MRHSKTWSELRVNCDVSDIVECVYIFVRNKRNIKIHYILICVLIW